MRLSKLFTGLLMVVALVVPVPSATAAVASGAIFNDPRDPAKQNVIVNHLRSLIQGAAVGSSIRIAIYHFNDANIAADLVAAHNRGVDVRIVQDFSDSATTPSKTLKTALGSKVTVCTEGRACI